MQRGANPCKGASAAAGKNKTKQKRPRLGLPSRALSWTEFQAHKRGANFELSLPECVWLCKCVSRFWKTSRVSCREGPGTSLSSPTARARSEGASPFGQSQPQGALSELCPSGTASLLAFLFMTCWTSAWPGWGALKPSIPGAFSVLLLTLASRRQTIFRVGKPLP